MTLKNDMWETTFGLNALNNKIGCEFLAANSHELFNNLRLAIEIVGTLAASFTCLRVYFWCLRNEDAIGSTVRRWIAWTMIKILDRKISKFGKSC